MKKYFLGLFAVVMALAFSAFTSNVTGTMEKFVYQDPSGLYLEDDVEDESLWINVTSGGCSTQEDDVACTIEIDSDKFTGSGSDQLSVLAPAIQVIPEEGNEANKFRVAEVKESGNTIVTPIYNVDL